MGATKRTETMSTKLVFPPAAITQTQAKGLWARTGRWLRARWRCFLRTGWAHEVDLHAGTCRFCGKHVDQRL